MPLKRGETTVHAMSRTSFYRMLLMREGIVSLLVCGGLIVAGIILSVIFGIEALLVTLLFIFVALPVIVLFLYLVHALKPVTVLNTSPHRLSLGRDTLEIELPDAERKIEISYEDTGNYYVYGNGVVLTMRSRRQGWLWIPLAAFNGDKDEFANFLNSLYSSAHPSALASQSS